MASANSLGKLAGSHSDRETARKAAVRYGAVQQFVKQGVPVENDNRHQNRSVFKQNVAINLTNMSEIIQGASLFFVAWVEETITVKKAMDNPPHQLVASLSCIP